MSMTRISLLLSILLTATPLFAQPAGNQFAKGTGGAVAAEHRLASAAGIEILNAGGNAVDAAVAAVLTTGVVNPSSSGLGGGGFMLVFLAQAARAYAIDFRETAPSDAEADMFVAGGKGRTDASKTGGLAVAVPGEPAGMAMALDRFGTMSFAEVAAPAIRVAREGFPVEPHLARALLRAKEQLAADPVLASEFLRADGTTYDVGDTLPRPHLAATLELLGRDGASAFYAGAIADDIVATVGGAGGILSASDMSGYAPVEREVLTIRYRNWRILGMPPPSSGGGVIAETLAVLKPYALADLGNDSATYVHLVAEVLKAAFADRANLYGDPDFFDVPLQRLLSPQRIAGIRNRLSPAHVVPASVYGRTDAGTDAGTSHISVVDDFGNAVSCTTSINTAFGSKVGVPGRGIVLNNTMDDFSLQPGVPNAYGLVGSQANAIAPGKRPLSSMSPTVVLEDDRVRLVVGASGGPLIITGTVETLLNVLAFSMDVRTAVDAPRFHNQWMPDVLAVESTLAAPVRASLMRLGHRVVDMPHAAAVQAIEVFYDGELHRVHAASDARKGGVALAQ